ncbi:MAG: hypothetical protein V3S16_16000, partial [Candidatus Desulfatibia sp.]|uniref:hypothetical protein n=1 Tax=Candidatus Desulfatibia sp. TaxID=3101189 RepID=UPI002F32E4E3
IIFLLPRIKATISLAFLLYLIARRRYHLFEFFFYLTGRQSIGITVLPLMELDKSLNSVTL